MLKAQIFSVYFVYCWKVLFSSTRERLSKLFSFLFVFFLVFFERILRLREPTNKRRWKENKKKIMTVKNTFTLSAQPPPQHARTTIELPPEICSICARCERARCAYMVLVLFYFSFARLNYDLMSVCVRAFSRTRNNIDMEIGCISILWMVKLFC